MNTIWSDHVQGIMTLYLSRKLRFDDMFFDQYKSLFNLDQSATLNILEIGCGPGHLRNPCVNGIQMHILPPSTETAIL